MPRYFSSFLADLDIRNKGMTTAQKIIPKDWTDINLGNVCDFERGIETGADAYNTEGIGERFLRVVDVTESRSHPIYVDVPTTKKMKKTDIAITLDGTIGAVKMGLEGVYSTGVRKVSFKDKANSNRLLYYILQSYEIQKTIELYSSGSTIKHASSAIPHLVSIIPNSFEEQQKIADILALIDEAIEKTEVVIEKHKLIKIGMMQDLFRYGIDEKGNIRNEETHKFKNSPQGRIPDEWVISEVGKLFEMQLGKMLNEKAKIGNSQKSYLTNRDVQWEQVSVDNLGTMNFSTAEQKKYSLKNGDLLICEGGEVGRTALWREELEDCYFQKAIHRLRPLNSTISNIYALYYFVWAINVGLHKNLVTQTSIAHLTREKLALLPVLVPSPKEQSRIAEIIEKQNAVISNEENSNNKLRAIRNGLMGDLLTGTVRANHLIGK